MNQELPWTQKASQPIIRITWRLAVTIHCLTLWLSYRNMSIRVNQTTRHQVFLSARKQKFDGWCVSGRWQWFMRDPASISPWRQCILPLPGCFWHSCWCVWSGPDPTKYPHTTETQLPRHYARPGSVMRDKHMVRVKRVRNWESCARDRRPFLSAAHTLFTSRCCVVDESYMWCVWFSAQSKTDGVTFMKDVKALFSYTFSSSKAEYKTFKNPENKIKQ